MSRPAVHFVGFRGDEYSAARRVWGTPDFVHYNWDRRAQRDIAPGDTVVFARHGADHPPSVYSGNDIFEEIPK
jgi:hypothetical protein